MEYNINDKNSIDGLEALDIMSGKGVCLNFSSMLKDFLNISGFDSAILANNVDKKTKIDYIPKIKKNIAKEKFKTKIKNMIYTPLLYIIESGNHAFNLNMENNEFYIYDPTPFLLLEQKNVNTTKVINGNGKFTLKPHCSYSLNCFDNDEQILDKFYQTQNFSSPYNKEDYILIWKENIDLINSNKNLLNDYYGSSKENIDAILKKLLIQKKK